MDTKEIKYAGFWIRFVASFLDTLFLALPIAVVIYFLSDGEWFDWQAYWQNMQLAMMGDPSALSNQPVTSMRWELFFETSVLVVTIIFWKQWGGTTPGKRMMGIKIVDAKTFNDITNKQAITRSIGYIPSTFLFCIGFLMVAFRNDKRALHDLLASTSVIYNI